MREVDIVGVRYEQPDYAPVLVLQESDGGRFVPIWIGQAEAAAISLQQQGVEPGRPLTHDLVLSILEEFDHQLRAVEIIGLTEGTFFAELVFSSGERIAARPSDAVAIAMRAEVSVSVAVEILESVGIVDSESGGDEQVEKFREFLDSVTPDDFLTSGPSDEPGDS